MKLLLVVLFFAAVSAKHEEYDGYKSYFVGPATFDQLKEFGQMVVDLNLDVMSHPLNTREGVVLVQPYMQEEFTMKLDKMNVPYRIHSDDVKNALDAEDELILKRRQETRTRNGGRTLPYNDYQDWNAIEQYLIDIAERYPELVTLVRPAKSFQGRDLIYLKISSTNFEDESKPVIFIDGGTHAREWISPPTVTWAIHKLVENNTDPDLLERFDWILFPVVNPDGYQYSFDNTRLWRKTMSTNTNTISYLCPGVDGNRNYDFYWATVGTSSNPCSDTYPGNVPFSEVEIRAVRDTLVDNLHRIALYITMHSYGSMILYPWGHDGSLSANAFGLHTVGVAMAESIDSISLPNFPKYIVGNSVLVIGYAASGAAEDYAHSIGVPLSYTYELPGLSWSNGFHLDPRYIQQVAEETWLGIATGARRAGDIVVQK